MDRANNNNALSEALRIIRVFHDLSQIEAAKALEISAPYLSQLGSGQKTASIDVIQKYTSAFDVPASSIFLLSERIQNADYSYESPSSLAAPKILRILDWLHETNKAVPKKPARRIETQGHFARKRA